MEAYRPEIRFLHVAGKTGNDLRRAIWQYYQHYSCKGFVIAVRGKRAPFTVSEFEPVNIIPIQTMKCKLKYIKIFKANVLT